MCKLNIPPILLQKYLNHLSEQLYPGGEGNAQTTWRMWNIADTATWEPRMSSWPSYLNGDLERPNDKWNLGLYASHSRSSSSIAYNYFFSDWVNNWNTYTSQLAEPYWFSGLWSERCHSKNAMPNMPDCSLPLVNIAKKFSGSEIKEHGVGKAIAELYVLMRIRDSLSTPYLGWLIHYSGCTPWVLCNS